MNSIQITSLLPVKQKEKKVCTCLCPLKLSWSLHKNQ